MLCAYIAQSDVIKMTMQCKLMVGGVFGCHSLTVDSILVDSDSLIRDASVSACAVELVFGRKTKDFLKPQKLDLFLVSG